MAELPAVLAGPILRRCSPSEITIWVATSFEPEDVTVTLAVVDAKGKPSSLGDVDETFEVLQLGKALWITLERARPSNGKKLPFETVMTYDLRLKRSGTWTSVADLVSGGADSISFDGMPGPTFFLPSGQREALVFAHGSCRKAHGRGADALAALDAFIAGAPAKVTRRPAFLALTGDQIYADDVATPLLEHLHTLIPKVIGYTETLPGPSKGHISLPAAGARQKLVHELGFTSDAARSHVLSFGEYMLLYLLSWNEALWPERFEATKDAQAIVKALEASRAALPAVRRVLANCPTYMMFDDHDVTDDWNLDADWLNGVKGNSAGRRVVAHALGAFLLFQAWGNDPDSIPTALVQRVHDYAGDLLKGQGAFDVKIAKLFDQAMWDFHGWSCATPTTPPLLLVDTRTQRDFTAGKFPRLISDDGLTRLASLAKRVGVSKHSPLLLTVATPVYGMTELEEQQAKRDRYEYDRENWMANLWSYIEFISFVREELEPSYCLFLAGDVHYAFSVGVRYTQTRSHRRTGTRLSGTEPLVSIS